MDVAYRLYPEADMQGMLSDVRRSIARLRAHACLRSVDASVRGVIAYYGPVDLAGLYRYCHIARLAAATPHQPDWNAPVPPRMHRMMGPDAERLKLHRSSASGRLDWILGGTPEEVPERYALFSPITHVHPGCQPTLLIHGAADAIVPAADGERKRSPAVHPAGDFHGRSAGVSMSLNQAG